MIDLAFRSVTRARWLEWATTRGIYNSAGETVPGYDVDEIGFLELSPGVFDTWHFVHVRQSLDKAVADIDGLFLGEIEEGIMFTKSKLAASVRALSIPVTFNGWRAYQVGLLGDRVQLIDPRDYAASKKREYLGGMAF